MIAIDPVRLETAVASLCPEIEDRVAISSHEFDERRLWWELSCCVTSSQVEYSLAVQAANAIIEAGLLPNHGVSIPELTAELRLVLKRPLHLDGKVRFYRFPNLRSRQIAEIYETVTSTYGSLETLISSEGDPSSTRTWLVDNAPGLGPKQASMFLRNAGVSYNLAILDRHVLRYMATLGMSDKSTTSITVLDEYQRKEDMLRKHAEKLGHSVGLLDWAIWIVMRVARKQQLEVVRLQ